MNEKTHPFKWDESEPNAHNISEYRTRQGAMKAYKFRLYPSVDQEKLLNNQLNLCRELYNTFLQQRIYAYRSGTTGRLWRCLNSRMHSLNIAVFTHRFSRTLPGEWINHMITFTGESGKKRTEKT